MTDTERLDWLEAQHTLHRSVEFLYVVDGYRLTQTYDGNALTEEYGETIRAAIDKAMTPTIPDVLR